MQFTGGKSLTCTAEPQPSRWSLLPHRQKSSTLTWLCYIITMCHHGQWHRYCNNAGLCWVCMMFSALPCFTFPQIECAHSYWRGPAHSPQPTGITRYVLSWREVTFSVQMHVRDPAFIRCGQHQMHKQLNNRRLLTVKTVNNQEMELWNSAFLCKEFPGKKK